MPLIVRRRIASARVEVRQHGTSEPTFYKTATSEQERTVHKVVFTVDM